MPVAADEAQHEYVKGDGDQHVVDGQAFGAQAEQTDQLGGC